MAEEVNWYMINQCDRLGDILNNKNTKQTIHIVKRQDYPGENINKVKIEKIIQILIVIFNIRANVCSPLQLIFYKSLYFIIQF